MIGFYKIANRIIKIQSLYEEVHTLCSNYAVDVLSPDIVIRVLQEDIDQEREKSIEEDRFEGIQERFFHDSYLETIAVYRKLVISLLSSDVILFHGSAVAVDGQAYLFTAKSGTGKSTHVRLWKKLLGDKAIIINDDKPLLQISKSEISVYGTPWSGKHNLNTNTQVPLKAICFLERSERNLIDLINPSRVFPRLYQQTYKPDDVEGIQKTMELLEMLIGQVPMYRLRCNMEIEAAALALKAMKEDNE